MIRMAEQSKLLLRWQTDVARGRVPDELAHLEEDEAMSVARRELADMIENELKFLPYFYPKMQQVESDTRVSGELSLLDLLKATNTDGSTKGSD